MQPKSKSRRGSRFVAKYSRRRFNWVLWQQNGADGGLAAAFCRHATSSLAFGARRSALTLPLVVRCYPAPRQSRGRLLQIKVFLFVFACICLSACLAFRQAPGGLWPSTSLREAPHQRRLLFPYLNARLTHLVAFVKLVK